MYQVLNKTAKKIGLPMKNKGLTGKEIIMKEKEIWQTAYPKQKKLLEDFANKIFFELRFRYLEDKE